MSTTIRDVAEACGVSTATVSNVLNNADRPVHPRTRERVLEAARRLDYHPNAVARRLQGQPLYTIGALFGMVEPEVITNPYASLVLKGILIEAARRGYNVTLWTSRWKNTSESIATLRDNRADGYVVVAPALDSDMVQGIAAHKLPLVVVSSQFVPEEVPYVDVDNQAGLRIATEHMIALGHTRIAHMSGDEHQPSVADRRAGYLEAMWAAGLPVPSEYLVTSWYMIEESKPQTRALLTLPPGRRPTAIVTGSDNIAVGILQVAQEMGIRVPEELSVTGFDDIPPATLVQPQLTTVRQPLAELGERATRTLLDRIEGKEGVIRHLAEPTLIVRGSTAAPPPSSVA